MSARVDVDALRRLPALCEPQRVAAVLGLDRGAKRQARGLLVLCPNHEEHTPSCSVVVGRDGTLAARCFGCGFSADVLGLVAVVNGLDASRDFRAVVALAAELAGAEVPTGEGRAVYHEPEPAPEPAPSPSDAALDAACSVLATLGRLDASPLSCDVTRYLEARGLLADARAAGCWALPCEPEQPELIAWLASVADTAGDDVAAEHAPRFTRADLDALGWLPRVPHPGHRVCIPWRSPEGVVTTVQRRRLVGPEPRYVFPRARAPRWPYGVEALRGAPADAPIVFCEGALDALALRRIARERDIQGVPLGLPGATTWREEWTELCRGRRVVLALDADDAGERACAELAARLEPVVAGLTRQVPCGGVKDWAAVLVPEVTA